jgi:23S rRNA pseudouridine2605 synthase
VLARAGIASRRAVEALVTAGRVEVNGQRVTELGLKIDVTRDRVRVDGRPIEVQPAGLQHWLVYKPKGMMTTLSDPQARPTVGRLVSGLGVRLFPVGRLDYDAEGLLLMTNDGDLTFRLTHPKFQVRRTYLVKVRGVPAPEELSRLAGGIDLEEGRVSPIEVVLQATTESNSWIRIAVAEGRPHLVKRLCESIGRQVQRLVRVEYAGLTLADLATGARRRLLPEEVAGLREQASGEHAPRPYPGLLPIPPRGPTFHAEGRK